MLKNVVRVIVGLVIGIGVGLGIAGVILMAVKGIPFHDYITKIGNVDISEGFLAVLVGIVSFFVSLFILIIIHEAGHLVCGLLTGYKFVSFRILNFTFIKSNGKIRVKRFGVAGTQGQCLLLPPDMPVDSIPVGWYNAGGVLANLVVMAAMLPLLWVDMNPFLSEFVVLFLCMDLFLILMNGIPMQVGGVGNDAYNILLLRKNSESKRGIVNQLRSNALIQEGVRPKDMPDEWFVASESINYNNPLAVSIPIMSASRSVDMMEWDKAYKEYSKLYEHKDEIMALYVKEIICELIFLSLVTGRTERAKSLFDADIRKYVESYRKVMSSKERLLCAVSLYIDNDRDGAVAIYKNLSIRKTDYLLAGEVTSDLAIMRSMLAAGEHLADFEDEFVNGFVGDDKSGGEDDEDAAPDVACGDGLSEYQNT